MSRKALTARAKRRTLRQTTWVSVQTSAFEIVDGVVQALYVVRNSDKLRHVPAVRSSTS